MSICTFLFYLINFDVKKKKKTNARVILIKIYFWTSDFYWFMILILF